MLTVVAGGAIVFAFGLLDDVVHLHPAAKLGAQLAAAYVVLQSSISVEFVSSSTLGWAIGMIWLVGLTNAFNLLDNMDGLAGSLGVVAASCFALSAAFVAPNRDIFIIATALALALLGFIPYNLRLSGPARVFMGDSGSQLIGFVLATLGLMASYKEAGTTIATVALPVLILAIPILDTTLVTTLRLRSGRSVTQGGRDHTSHRLVYRGLSERRAVFFLVAVSAALGLTSLAYAVLDSGRITTIGVLVTFALLLQFAAFLSGVAAAPGESGLSTRASLLVDTLVDGALTVAAFYAAYVVVVEGNGTPYQRHIFIWALPAVLFARYLGLFAFGLYRADRQQREAEYAGADRRCRGRVGACGVPLRDQHPDAARLPGSDLPPRRGDLLRVPRRRAIRGARRPEGLPHLAQAQPHRDRLVTGAAGGAGARPAALVDRLLAVWPLLVAFLGIARAVRLAGVEPPDAVALLRRDRVRADLPGDLGDRQAGAARRRVLGHGPLPVADRPVLVDRQPADAPTAPSRPSTSS